MNIIRRFSYLLLKSLEEQIFQLVASRPRMEYVKTEPKCCLHYESVIHPFRIPDVAASFSYHITVTV